MHPNILVKLRTKAGGGGRGTGGGMNRGWGGRMVGWLEGKESRMTMLSFLKGNSSTEMKGPVSLPTTTSDKEHWAKSQGDQRALSLAVNVVCFVQWKHWATVWLNPASLLYSSHLHIVWLDSTSLLYSSHLQVV